MSKIRIGAGFLLASLSLITLAPGAPWRPVAQRANAASQRPNIVLLLSELAANAARHTGSGERGGVFTTRLVDVPGEYVLGLIEDGGSKWDGDLRASARNASGLHLVLALSADCGVYGGARNRTVWFQVLYPPGDRAANGHAVAPGRLPRRLPGAQGPPSRAPAWNTGGPGQTAIGPDAMERARAALRRM